MSDARPASAIELRIDTLVLPASTPVDRAGLEMAIARGLARRASAETGAPGRAAREVDALGEAIAGHAWGALTRRGATEEPT